MCKVQRSFSSLRSCRQPSLNISQSRIIFVAVWHWSLLLLTQLKRECCWQQRLFISTITCWVCRRYNVRHNKVNVSFSQSLSCLIWNLKKKISNCFIFSTSLLVQQQTNQMKDNNEGLGWAERLYKYLWSHVQRPRQGFSAILLLAVYMWSCLGPIFWSHIRIIVANIRPPHLESY